MSLLTKYGLDKVTYTNEGTFTTYDELCDKLLNLYKDVAESSIHSEEEGSVLYFIGNFQTLSEKVLSLCKLKTLEYRVLRKLREKLRNFVDACQTGKGNTDVKSKLESFIKETNELCEGYQLPHDISVYQEIGQLGFDSLFSNRSQQLIQLLNEKYIDFLMEIMK